MCLFIRLRIDKCVSTTIIDEHKMGGLSDICSTGVSQARGYEAVAITMIMLRSGRFALWRTY